jgi:predicted dehydrogenase
MNRELRFLLSGPGLMGRKHVALLKENLDTRLAAIVAPAHSRNIELAAAEGVRLFSTVGEAIETEQIDAAIISSPNVFHYDQAMRCVESGIPALVEKPITDSLSSAAALASAAAERKVSLLVGHHRTYSPLLEVARAFMTSEKFGNAVCVQGAALFYKPADYFASGPWRTRLGGGPILINLIHEVGILRFLVGEIESVAAKFSRATREFEVEDSSAIIFSFRNGAIGTFLLSDASASSKSWEMTAGENPVYPHFPEQNCYHFSGTMGSLDFPSMRFRTYFGTPNRSWWQPFDEGQLSVKRHDPLTTQLKHFVDVVRGNAVPLVTARDGYLNMVIIEAIVKAANSSREVRISEIAE